MALIGAAMLEEGEVIDRGIVIKGTIDQYSQFSRETKCYPIIYVQETISKSAETKTPVDRQEFPD